LARVTLMDAPGPPFFRQAGQCGNFFTIVLSNFLYARPVPASPPTLFPCSGRSSRLFVPQFPYPPVERGGQVMFALGTPLLPKSLVYSPPLSYGGRACCPSSRERPPLLTFLAFMSSLLGRRLFYPFPPMSWIPCWSLSRL